MNRPVAVAIGVTVLVAGFLIARRGGPPEAAHATPLPTQVEIERALSGHKIQLETDERIIYAGIRAPYPHEPLHEKAKERNAELVDDEDARLRYDTTRKDRKDRTLAYVSVNGHLVNERLVREGLAYVRLDYDARRFAEQLLQAQSAARHEGRGIWAFFKDRRGEFHGDVKYANYHRPDCVEVPKIKAARHMVFASTGEAVDQGYAPCAVCRP